LISNMGFFVYTQQDNTVLLPALRHSHHFLAESHRSSCPPLFFCSGGAFYSSMHRSTNQSKSPIPISGMKAHRPSCPVSCRWRGEKADHVVYPNANTDEKLLEAHGFVKIGVCWSGELTEKEADELRPKLKVSEACRVRIQSRTLM